MPLPPQIQSDIAALVASLPTVKEAVLAKQGLRLLRDELLYKHPQDPLQPHQTERLQALGLTSFVMDWIASPEGKTLFEDFKNCGPDAVLQAFDAQLKTVELIQITLAYKASPDDAARFHKWFSQVLDRAIMLDVRYNPQLLAGIVFVYQNHLYDYSLKQRLPQIEDMLLASYRQMSLSATVSQLPSPTQPIAPGAQV